MAMTIEEFVEKSGGEVVAGNIIVGVMSTRKIVGVIENGTFNLNADGQAILAALEAGKPDAAAARAPRKKATDTAGKTAEDLSNEV
jgi:hypothetical protein